MRQKKVTVLGCGLIGKTIAIDLCSDYFVTSIDANTERLKEVSLSHNVNVLQKDLSDKNNLCEVIKNADLVISAVPGFMGFETLKSIIQSGKNVVDISFFAEDAFRLDELAKSNNITAIVDCGVAPGLSNIILGYHNKRLKISSFECFVGGLPLNPKLPFNYKAPFSPTDVIEEYLRPARVVENGRVITKEALSDSEIIEFDKVGKLEAFFTDGLRTLLKTMNIPNMKEKTLRYPGHIDIIKLLKQIGFFDSNEIEIDGKKIKPIDITTQLIFPHWRLEKDEREFTILRVIIRGGGKEIVYDIYDEYNVETQTTSMARTTGYTCTAAARLVLENQFNRKGICTPEFIGEEEKCFDYILSYLNERKVKLTKQINPI